MASNERVTPRVVELSVPCSVVDPITMSAVLSEKWRIIADIQLLSGGVAFAQVSSITGCVAAFMPSVMASLRRLRLRLPAGTKVFFTCGYRVCISRIAVSV